MWFLNSANHDHTARSLRCCSPVEDTSLHLATVTLGEIQAGLELTREQDADKARVNGLTVVTRNVADFTSFGAQLLNPFDFGSSA